MPLIKNNIALVSIHIPKTGGSSFQKSLQSLYGPEAFQRLDFTVREGPEGPHMLATNRTSQALLDELCQTQVLPAAIKIVHGHFHFADFARFFQLDPGVKVVSWLRDPLRRIVSNYHYLITQFEGEIQHTALSRQLFKRLAKNLTEYADNQRDVQLYSDYLGGRALEHYDFVGIVEDYEEEMNRLAAILDVETLSRFKVNRAKEKAPALSSAQKSALVELNEKNNEIYQLALKIRAEFATAPVTD